MRSFHRSRFRQLELEDDHTDPLTGVANLFDLAMVFALALLVAMTSHFNLPELLTEDDLTLVKEPGTEQMEIIVKDGPEITRYRATGELGQARGKKVGTAYQLEDGRVIYVPE